MSENTCGWRARLVARSAPCLEAVDRLLQCRRQARVAGGLREPAKRAHDRDARTREAAHLPREQDQLVDRRPCAAPNRRPGASAPRRTRLPPATRSSPEWHRARRAGRPRAAHRVPRAHLRSAVPPSGPGTGSAASVSRLWDQCRSGVAPPGRSGHGATGHDWRGKTLATKCGEPPLAICRARLLAVRGNRAGKRALGVVAREFDHLGERGHAIGGEAQRIGTSRGS